MYGDWPSMHVKTQVANLDGSQLKNYSGALPNNVPMDFNSAVDHAADKKYSTVAMGQKVHSVKRANLDGSNTETLVTNLPWPTEITLDVKRGKMYWLDTGIPDSVGGSINRANLDGSNWEVVIKGNASWAVSPRITLDLDTNTMLLNRPGFLSQANLDGSGFEDIIATGSPLAGQLALDKSGGWLYWSEGSLNGCHGSIKRVAFPLRPTPAPQPTPPPTPEPLCQYMHDQCQTSGTSGVPLATCKQACA